MKTWRIRPLFLLALMLACASGADDLYAYTPDKGMLLVANERLTDPRFRDRVILLIQHDAQGSAGLVINRASRLPLAKVLPQGSRLIGEGRTLSYGGPVEPQTLLALLTVRKHPPEPADEVIEGLYVTGVGVLNEWSDFAEEVIDYRAFVGYTGWAPGQLNIEMQRGDWQVVPADGQTVFSAEGVQLWERLRQTIPAE